MSVNMKTDWQLCLLLLLLSLYHERKTLESKFCYCLDYKLPDGQCFQSTYTHHSAISIRIPQRSASTNRNRSFFLCSGFVLETG